MPAVTAKGMHCSHCSKSVTDAVAKIPGVASVNVDLATGLVTWEDKNAAAPVSPEAVKQAIRAIGFDAA